MQQIRVSGNLFFRFAAGGDDITSSGGMSKETQFGEATILNKKDVPEGTISPLHAYITERRLLSSEGLAGLALTSVDDGTYFSGEHRYQTISKDHQSSLLEAGGVGLNSGGDGNLTTLTNVKDNINNELSKSEVTVTAAFTAVDGTGDIVMPRGSGIGTHGTNIDPAGFLSDEEMERNTATGVGHVGIKKNGKRGAKSKDKEGYGYDEKSYMVGFYGDGGGALAASGNKHKCGGISGIVPGLDDSEKTKGSGDDDIDADQSSLAAVGLVGASVKAMKDSTVVSGASVALLDRSQSGQGSGHVHSNSGVAHLSKQKSGSGTGDDEDESETALVGSSQPGERSKFVMESAVVINRYDSEVSTVHISGTEIVSPASQSKLYVPASASDREGTPVDPDPVVATAATMSMAAMEAGNKAGAELGSRSHDDSAVMVVDVAGVGAESSSGTSIASGGSETYTQHTSGTGVSGLAAEGGAMSGAGVSALLHEERGSALLLRGRHQEEGAAGVYASREEDTSAAGRSRARLAKASMEQEERGAVLLASMAEDSSALARACRCALPLQMLMLLLLGVACLVPMSEEDFNCALANNFENSLFIMLKYKDGHPPF